MSWKKIEGSIAEGGEIDDALYVDTDDGEEYSLSFSRDRSRVDIRPGDISARLESEMGNKLKYFIDEGFQAGGRLVVSAEDWPISAELTEYGSGVAIVASVKGVLTWIPD